MEATKNIDYDSRRFCIYTTDNNGANPMPIDGAGNWISPKRAKNDDGLLDYLEALAGTKNFPGSGVGYWTGTEFVFLDIEKADGISAKYNSSTGTFETTPKLEVIDATSLQEKDIPPLKFLVDGILPEQSLGIVVAPPKYYKSFLCLDLALCIASGNEFLGRKVRKGVVLYEDLEATERRPKSRIEMILGGAKAPPDLYIGTRCERIGEGLKEQLADFKRTHPGLSLVVLDMLSNVRPPSSPKVNGYDRDRADLGQLEEIVRDLGISILTVHHTRKMKDEADVFNQISGTTGLLGTTDFVYLIDKKSRQDADATLYITGRDIIPAELAVTFDKSLMRWTYHGTADEYRISREAEEYEKNPLVRTIKKLLSSSDSWTGTVEEVISSSRYFGTPVRGDARVLGREIRKLEGQLLDRDGISIESAKADRGNKRILIISREALPFDNNS